MKTRGVGLLGVSASCAMSPAHLGHRVSVSCQCQAETRNANGVLPLRLSPSPLFPFLTLLPGFFEGGTAINILSVGIL